LVAGRSGPPTGEAEKIGGPANHLKLPCPKTAAVTDIRFNPLNGQPFRGNIDPTMRAANAAQIIEILNGGNPAEMPYFQQTHWELLINLKAAKALGLEIPAGLVAGADRVIE
jgi:hypothetical protein